MTMGEMFAIGTIQPTSRHQPRVAFEHLKRASCDRGTDVSFYLIKMKM